MSTIDLFGNTIEDKLPGGKMCQRFIEPPFSTLDQRAGRWQIGSEAESEEYTARCSRICKVAAR